VTERISKTDKS